MGPAWQLVTKWESTEPLKHRPPLPEPIYLAMLSLALDVGWLNWAAVTAIAFSGACRIGEPLRAFRADLLTPQDLMSELQTVYLRIREPKSRNRGAKVQHSTITDTRAVHLITKVFQDKPRAAKLYGGSPSVYRRRWDHLLRALGVQASLKLTPGSLRGGGALSLFRRGMLIADLQWQMRLKGQQTLAYYLQEVLADSVLPSLPESTRQRIQAAASMLPVYLSALA